MDRNEISKSKILESAMEIIKSEGIKSLTVQSVVKNCNVSKATFYKIFSSKEDLIYQLKGLNCGENPEITSTKEMIVKKAKEAFSKFGFYRMDMDSIAKLAGMNRVTLYHYFSCKEEILEYSVVHEFKIVKKMLRQYLEGVDDPAETVKKYLAQYCSFISYSRGNLLIPETWNQTYQNAQIMALTKDLIDYFIEMFSKVIDAGKQKGIFRSDVDTDSLAQIVMMVQSGMGLSIRIDPSIDETGKIKDALIKMVFDAIEKK